MASKTVDQKKAEEFAARFFGYLDAASLVQLASVGHETRLFDVMAGLEPSTGEQIARAAGLNERYVREWLDGLVAGGVVVYDPPTRKYSLPAEHAACLTRAAGPRNLASFAQVPPMLARVEGQVIRCFKNGGGVPYSAYARFQKLMADRSGQRFDALLVDTVLPLVPGIVPKLRNGIDVADVGCGSGHAINLMAREFPRSRFHGYDFSGDGIRAAGIESRRLRLMNTAFLVQDAAKLKITDRFDLITVFDAIHDQAHPRKVLANIWKALRPGGVFLMVDMAGSSDVEDNLELTLAPFKYTVSLMHCMAVSLGLNGEGLGTMWGEQKALELLGEAGFGEVTVKQVDGDFMNNYYIARKKG